MRLPGVICKCGSEDIFASQSDQHIKLICAKNADVTLNSQTRMKRI